VDILGRFTQQAPSVSVARRKAQLKVLRHFERQIAPISLLCADQAMLRSFLDGRRAGGAGPNTVRKERAMITAFYAWAWEHGHVGAETLLAMRDVPAPADSTGVARPEPYKRWEIQELWRVLDERWPRLPAEDVERWLRRFSEGRTPYSRVRSHAIHCQLEAIVALALSAGMRRGEIYACGVDDVHPDNEYLLIRRSDGSTREAPHNRLSREATAKWLQVRNAVKPPHARAWLNLWAGDTVTQPMTP
jgi:integrase